MAVLDLLTDIPIEEPGDDAFLPGWVIALAVVALVVAAVVLYLRWRRRARSGDQPPTTMLSIALPFAAGGPVLADAAPTGGVLIGLLAVVLIVLLGMLAAVVLLIVFIVRRVRRRGPDEAGA